LPERDCTLKPFELKDDRCAVAALVARFAHP
jgi:hypothetical protein